MGYIVGALILGVGVLLGRLLVAWLTNRPEKEEEYDSEDLLSEMEQAFVKREKIHFILTLPEVEPFFLKMTESVSLGFRMEQAQSLVERVTSRIQNQTGYSAFPVSVGAQPSDLEIWWVNVSETEIRIGVEAVNEVIDFTKRLLRDLKAHRE